MDAAHHWPQEFVVKPIDEIVTNGGLLCGVAPPPPPPPPGGNQRKPRPQKEQAVNCPRCNSTNTKFCYYNNYSLTQPRYFCKTCRRYWTEGGSLRNIPVGGGSRKNKRTNSSSLSNISTTSNSAASTSTTTSSSISKIGQNPSKPTQDLNLAFPPELLHLVPNNSTNLERGLLSSFMSMPDHHQNAINYTTTPPPPSGVFPSFHEIKPTLNFSLDGLGGGYRNSISGVPESAAGRLFFPFEELKQQQVSPSTSIDMDQSNSNRRGDHQQGSDHNSNGYWSGMLGGGSW